MTAPIFINYRIRDSHGLGVAFAMDLKRIFGSDVVFIDRDIEGGESWNQELMARLGEARIIVACIGPTWETARSSVGTTLADPLDWVRKELVHGLNSHTHVLPILIERSSPPEAEQIPDDLLGLLGPNPIRLSEEHWDEGVRKAALAITRLTGLQPPRPWYLLLRAVALVVVGMVLGIGLHMAWTNRERPFSEHYRAVIELGNGIAGQLEAGSPQRRAVDDAVRFVMVMDERLKADDILSTLEQQKPAGSKDWNDLVRNFEALTRP